MKTFLCILLAGSLWPAFAAAQNIGGTYTVRGTNFDGSPYGGEAQINIISTTTCEIMWKTAGETSSGFCMRNGDAFAAGYVMGDNVGLIIYKADADGTLRGLWTIKGMNGSGTEILTPK